MKVFMAATSFDPSHGGPAVSVSRLGEALAGRGVDVVLWSSDGSAASSSLLRDLPRVERRVGPIGNVMRSLAASLDLIHDSGIWLPHNHAIARVSRRLAKPRIVTPRGMLEPWSLAYRRAKKRLAWFAYQRKDLNIASGIHATADSEAANVQRLNLKPPIFVVPNGVDIPATRRAAASDQRTDQPRRALFLGRIHPKKGLDMLLEAWAQVCPEHWELVIAGPTEGGYGATIRQQAERLGVAPNVTIIGPAYGKEKASLFYSSDLFVLPTYSENFGMSVAEALAHELPVVTTRAAPWSLLETERCGWWVQPTVAGISEGLRAAIATPRRQLLSMGWRGRKAVEARFSWDHVAEAIHETIYRPLLSRGSGRAASSGALGAKA